MTIDEAIEMYKKIANTDSNCPRYCMNPCEKCVKEYKKVEEWLEELKELRNITASHLYAVAFKNGYLKAEKEVRNNAIDDLIAKCENAKFAESDEIALSDIHTGVNSGLSMSIHLAEQLKVGEENENYNKEES